ncbi:hypothetical protein GUITHDRAFT_100257 [Guillardia theta CCMP2712]|uniref:Uncharacterized protein n=1 Tax=Guillardia theta (strain CCMP2712) TaxID=905079 RepID=L1JZI6_GUITC|nr:hypothetical protein GUITHDRAFT_100257 [Guillardia theta CCMP2712]EKX54006.1 hypothetical protein GUITHDRAFT_100257 [Guillardia theta CCMP2712]|eukprot:XP_005840986.1 hypothetical protein GUITHDRAFT_100257 [Guillardia theta CCMP2712]
MTPTDMSAFVELWGSSPCVSPVSSSTNLVCDFSLLQAHHSDMAFLQDWEAMETRTMANKHAEEEKEEEKEEESARRCRPSRGVDGESKHHEDCARGAREGRCNARDGCCVYGRESSIRRAVAMAVTGNVVDLSVSFGVLLRVSATT